MTSHTIHNNNHHARHDRRRRAAQYWPNALAVRLALVGIIILLALAWATIAFAAEPPAWQITDGPAAAPLHLATMATPSANHAPLERRRRIRTAATVAAQASGQAAATIRQAQPLRRASRARCR